MARENNYKISYFDIILVVLIILKLTGTIDWSWWWVLSPLWVLAGLFILVAILTSR